ncbi:hypothetical protein N5K27_01910 [Pigmentiphaga sp. GD03639]|uniref:NAD(P)-dependent oxidoreductase n=1 Tax=Pigmentiphaga sp. GD03639 TaxID=2975354 RepID=UPI002447B320|nr:NAD(P)-dependent oxidoreductase [Pigmentiphaga sp. GD03639]MDH2235044.1 hypothetical protein [Pigmentiphaga sp. GD03639]
MTGRRLQGAALDVFWHEPLDPSSPLWALDNVIVTPHAASHSAGHAGRVEEIFLDNLSRWVSGAELRNRVA